MIYKKKLILISDDNKTFYSFNGLSIVMDILIFILEKCDEDDKIIIDEEFKNKILNRFKISSSTFYRNLKKLTNKNIIIKVSKFTYIINDRLVEINSFYSSNLNEFPSK